MKKITSKNIRLNSDVFYMEEIMNLPKQDRNGVRTPTDLERKYSLGKTNTKVVVIERKVNNLEKRTRVDDELSNESMNAIQNKVVTEALSNKVDKVEGKQLSTNDFTNEDKKSIHNHPNINVLETITQDDIDKLDCVLNLIADEYKNTTYDIGNYVIYNHSLYKCITAITVAEEWDENHWIKTTIMAELVDRKEVNYGKN